MASLIDPTKQWWDVEKVGSMLPPRAAEVLKLCWHQGTKKRDFYGIMRKMANIVQKVTIDCSIHLVNPHMQVRVQMPQNKTILEETLTASTTK